MRRFTRMILFGAALILTTYTFYKPSQRSPQQDVTLRKSFLKGQDFFEEGKWEQAAEQFQKDLVLDPKNSQAHLQLAILYDDYLARKEKAVEHYETYLKLTPNDEKSPLIRQWLQRAKEEMSQNPALAEMKGDSQTQLKKAEDALRALQQDYQRVRAERDQQSLILQRLQETLSQKERKLSELQAQILKVQAQKSDQEKSHAQWVLAKKDLDNATKTVEQLKKDKESLIRQVQELTNSKAELEKRFKALEGLQNRRDDEGLRNQRLRVLAYENKKLKESIRDLEAEGTRLGAQVEVLKASYGNLKKQFMDFQTKTRANEKTRARLASMRKYRVKKGESLRTIATLIYGDKEKWRMIYAANRSRIVDPDLLTPGQVLDIPPDTSSR